LPRGEYQHSPYITSKKEDVGKDVDPDLNGRVYLRDMMEDIHPVVR